MLFCSLSLQRRERLGFMVLVVDLIEFFKIPILPSFCKMTFLPSTLFIPLSPVLQTQNLAFWVLSSSVHCSQFFFLSNKKLISTLSPLYRYHSLCIQIPSFSVYFFLFFFQNFNIKLGFYVQNFSILHFLSCIIFMIWALS